VSAPQLTDANTSSEWFRTVADAQAGRRTPSQVTVHVARRRQGFVRLVTYTMIGLIAFTLLGLASFAWRRHAMLVALAAPVPLSASPAAMVLGAEPAAATGPVAPPLASKPLASKPLAAVATDAPRAAAKSATRRVLAKAKPTPTRARKLFLGAKKLAAKPATK
jgi:hypothetical protein